MKFMSAAVQYEFVDIPSKQLLTMWPCVCVAVRVATDS